MPVSAEFGAGGHRPQENGPPQLSLFGKHTKRHVRFPILKTLRRAFDLSYPLSKTARGGPRSMKITSLSRRSSPFCAGPIWLPANMQEKKQKRK